MLPISAYALIADCNSAALVGTEGSIDWLCLPPTTVTLALPKQGLRAPGTELAVGRLLLVDISVPTVVYEQLGIAYRTPFRNGPLVEITGPDESMRVSSSASPGSADG